MKKIEADFNRYVELEGVGPVSRPVDIDQSRTGFAELRTLRIYRFAAGSAIDGHAEEDEVLIVVLSGSIELTIGYGDDPGKPQTLSVAGDSSVTPCAAYLPPHATYRLVPHSPADIAYVRARPKDARAPKVFYPTLAGHAGSVTVLFEERSYAEKLRVRLTRAERFEGEIHLFSEADRGMEAIVHARGITKASATLTKSGLVAMPVEDWDSIALNPGDRPILQLANTSVVILTVLSVC